MKTTRTFSLCLLLPVQLLTLSAAAQLGSGATADQAANAPLQITALTRSHRAEILNAEVINPEADATAHPTATYSGDPKITSIVPASAVNTGGQVVSINGFNLQGSSGGKVMFGSKAASIVGSSSSSTHLVVKVPANEPGAVDVTVTNVDGQSVTIPSGFRYGQVLFKDGFESHDFKAWDYASANPDPANPRLSINNDPLFTNSGHSSAKFHYTICKDPANRACGDPHQDSNLILEKDFNTAGNPPGLYHVFVRGYVYFPTPQNGATKSIQRKLFFLKDPSGPNGSPNQHWGMTLTSDGTNRKIYLRVSFQSTVSNGVSFSLNGFDNEIGDSGVESGIAALNYDTWYAIEFEVQRKSSAGLSDCAVRVWVNGTLKFQKTQKWNRTQYIQPFPDDSFTTGITRIEIGNQADRQNYELVDEFRYWDDVVIADAYIGPNQ